MATTSAVHLGTDRDSDVDTCDDAYSIDNNSSNKPLQMAVLGRQNVGKSTLVNALLKQDRVLVGATPGLTRDAIAVEWTWRCDDDDGSIERPIRIVDTAGIRKRSQRAGVVDIVGGEDDVGGGIEDMAVLDAIRAMKTADVAVLVIDAGARMLQRQELAIADAVLKEGRALVVAANKMDLIVEEAGDDDDDVAYTSEDFENDVREQLEARFPFLRKTPIIAMSSLTGERVEELMPAVWNARERWSRVIPTSLLNRWLDDVVRKKPPPMGSDNRPVKLKYAIQTKGRPPTFLLFCNADSLPESYVRFLTRHFQDTFQMFGMQVRLAIKRSSSKNPYNTASGPSRGGSGVGGRERRRQKMIQHLKATGAPPSKRKRRRRKNK